MIKLNLKFSSKRRNGERKKILNNKGNKRKRERIKRIKKAKSQ